MLEYSRLCSLCLISRSRSENAEQLEELLLLTEEIQEELEQKDQLIVELKTQLTNL